MGFCGLTKEMYTNISGNSLTQFTFSFLKKETNVDF